MISGPCALPSPSGEAIFTQTVESILTSSGKGFVVWMRDNRIAVEPDVLLQMLLCQTSSIVNTQPQCSYSSGFSRPTLDNTGQAANNFPTYRQTVQKHQGGHTTSHPPSQETAYAPLRYDPNVFQSQQAVPIQSTAGWVPPKGESVVLKAVLFNGSISSRHVEISYPGFKLPDYIKNSLYQEHFNTPEAVVTIISDQNGKLRWSVNVPKSKIKTTVMYQENLRSAIKNEKSIPLADNETVMLVTRVRYGEISLEKGDLRHFYQGWRIPDHLVHSLKRECFSIPDGELYVFSDETGKLRHKVRIGRTDKNADNLCKLS